MRCCVIPFRVAPSVARHYCSRLPQFHLARDFTKSGDAPIDSADFVDVDTPALALDLAAVRDLSAGLDIERCLAKDYGGASVGKITLGNHLGADIEGIVAGESRRSITLRPS